MAEASLKLGTDWATKESSLLGYNDENGNYKPIPFDFSRASIGTRVNRDGLIEVVQDNIPRIDFSNGEGSLLLEPQRTNGITYTELSSFYSTTAITMSDNQGTSPDGGNNAFKALPTATDAQHIFFKANMGNAADTFTQSIFAKANGYNFCFIRFDSPTKLAFFDLANGVTAYADSGITSSIEDYGNGWYRCIATMTTTNYVNAIIGVSEAGSTLDDKRFNADGVNSVLFYGHQSELGSYSTSLIPTSGSAVTRVADECSKTSASDYIGQTEGTLYAEINYDISINQVLDSRIQLSDGTLSNWMFMAFPDGGIHSGSGNLPRFNVVSPSGTTSFNGSTSVSQGINKLAFAYAENDFVAYLNGSQIGINTNNQTIPACSQIYLQGAIIGQGAQERTNLNQFLLYKTRLSNAELAELTSL